MLIHILAGLIFVYLAVRLIVPLPIGKPAKLGLALLLLLLTQQHVISRLFGGLASPELPASLLMVQGWCFIFLLLLLLFTAAWDFVLIVRRAWKAMRGGVRPAYSPGRRQAITAGLAAATALYGVREAVRVPDVRDLDVTLPRLPAELDGLTIVQITDLHASHLLQGPWVQAVVDRVNALKPDLILFTGDMVDGVPSVRANDVAPLRRLKAGYGIFASVGNHEYYSNFSGWMRTFPQLGIRVLQNEHAAVDVQGCSLVVAGVTDVAAERFRLPGPDMAASLRGAPEEAVRILLEHRPGNAVENARHGFDLQLSGHTHGGQILGMNAVVAHYNEGFVYGWYTVGNMPLYVSSGTGLWNGFPVRIGVPAEIPRFILHSA